MRYLTASRLSPCSGLVMKRTAKTEVAWWISIYLLLYV